MSIKIMSIINFNTNSFYGKSQAHNLKQALVSIEHHLKQGADIIDIGVVSTAPKSMALELDQEIKQVELVLSVAIKEFPSISFSIDTYRYQVAKVALDLGVDIINDVSGGDAKMFKLMSKYPDASYVLMHSGEKPHVFSEKSPIYEKGVVSELNFFFCNKMQEMKKFGLSNIFIDPGFGFGKTLGENHELLNSLESFKTFKKPILVGLSRKRMIWGPLEIKAENALNGTVVANTIAAIRGADILRVHDTFETKQLIKLIDLLSLH